MVSDHSWTVGNVRLGSNAPVSGAVPNAAIGGLNCELGFTVGVQASVLKLLTTLPSRPLTIGRNCRTAPGTFPPSAVTMNVFTVSKAIPYPARTTVLSFPNGDQATPSRRAKAFR